MFFDVSLYGKGRLERDEIFIPIVSTRIENSFHQDTIRGVVKIHLAIALFHFEHIDSLDIPAFDHIHIVHLPSRIFALLESCLYHIR